MSKHQYIKNKPRLKRKNSELWMEIMLKKAAAKKDLLGQNYNRGGTSENKKHEKECAQTI